PLFTLLPDGKQPLTESIELLTDISTSLSGVEQRTPLRAYPHYRISAFYEFAQAARSQRFLLSAGRRTGFPLFMHEVQRGGYADAGVAADSQVLCIRREGAPVLRSNSGALDTEWPLCR